MRDPTKLLSGIFVRPEDLDVYEEAGVTRFKVSGRNHPTPWLVRAARAYADRHYAGDLGDILSLVQLRGPLRALSAVGASGGPDAEAARVAFEVANRLTIDNTAFPKGFLRHIANVDCDHLSCADCGYCPSVARRVLRIGGRPVDEYRPPTDLPPAVRLLGLFGRDVPEPPPPAARPDRTAARA